MFMVRSSFALESRITKSLVGLSSIRFFSCIPDDKNHFDIIIAGGGMVGTTLACTLGKNSKLYKKRIMLLEAGKQPKWECKEQYSNRVSALNPNTRKLLDSIGAWKHIELFRCAPVRKLQVWDALSEALITFNHDDMSEILAYIVENDVLLAAVGKELCNTKNVTVVNEAKIKSYRMPQETDEVVKVDMENGTTYTCRLLLGCDGANSQVRRAMGIKYLSWNYKQMGVVATLKLSEPTENIVAWQRFLPTGPIALLPLTKNLSSLVWSTTTEQAKTLLSLQTEQFVDAVNDAIWKKYPRPSAIAKTAQFVDGLLKFAKRPSNAIRQLPPSVCGCEEGSRAAFPLGFGHATCYVAKGVALVGDAAHRVHPLAGQGVNLGFGDVACINELIGEAIYSGCDVDDLNYLKQYESKRQRHNVPTMLAIDGLQKLYNTSFPPLVALRSLGLQLTHALPPLKKAIIGQAAH